MYEGIRELRTIIAHDLGINDFPRELAQIIFEYTVPFKLIAEDYAFKHITLSRNIHLFSYMHYTCAIWRNLRKCSLYGKFYSIRKRTGRFINNTDIANDDFQVYCDPAIKNREFAFYNFYNCNFVLQQSDFNSMSVMLTITNEEEGYSVNSFMMLGENHDRIPEHIEDDIALFYHLQ